MHDRALFCLSISTITGARLDKTHAFDVKEGGFGLNAKFTPLRFVRQAELAQPITVRDTTYFFSFDPSQLLGIAQASKKDLIDEIKSELRRLNATERKLDRDWKIVSQDVEKEMQELNAKGGPPQLRAAESAPNPALPPAAPARALTPSPALQAEPLSPVDDIPPKTEDSAPKTPVSSSSQPRAPKEESPGSGNVLGNTHNVDVYEVYFAAVKAVADPKTKAVGYSAFSKHVNTGKVEEITGDGKSQDLSRVSLMALVQILEVGTIPNSASPANTVITIFHPDEYLTRFPKYIRVWAKKGWKKKDGADVKHKDLFERIYARIEHVVFNGQQLTEDDEGYGNYIYCAEKAHEAAIQYHQQNYGLIPTGNYTGND